MISRRIMAVASNHIIRHIKNHIETGLPKGIAVVSSNFRAHEAMDPIQNGAFGLRYRVMHEAKKPTSPFPDTHYCIDTENSQFHDKADFYPSTHHINIVKDGVVVGSSRYVDGRTAPLEMEDYRWYDIRKIHPALRDGNFAEPSRVVGCPSVRGSAVIPLMYVVASVWAAEEKIGGYIGLVNERAAPLLRHYQKWIGHHAISESFETPEYIPGNRCIVFYRPISNTPGPTATGTATGTANIAHFIVTNIFPVYIVYRAKALQDRWWAFVSDSTEIPYTQNR
jgi:hypothetical protein